MRTIQVTLYSAAELKEHCPGGFQKALQWWKRTTYEDPAWLRESQDSLAAVLKCFPKGERWHGLQGPRAMAWVENNILGPLRQPWYPLRHPKRRATSRHGGTYRPGYVEPCPFTGYCMDDALLDFIQKEVRAGWELRQVHRDITAEWERLVEADIEWQASEESFLDGADANGYEFDASGTLQ